MKHSVGLVILILLVTLGCNKQGASSGSQAPAATFQSMSDAQRLSAFSSDPDMRNILSIQMEATARLVKSGIDFTTFDFSDQAKVLIALGYSREQYLAKINSVRASALAFISRYKIPAGKAPCSTCSMSQAEKFAGLGSLLHGFQSDDQSFERFKSVISQRAGVLVAAKPPTVSSTAGCSIWFYVCVSLCASAVEALPVYLLCCAYCIHTECTTN